jgi:hypothetical protein
MGGVISPAFSSSTGPRKQDVAAVRVVDGAYMGQHPSTGTTAQTRAGFLCLACGHAENADLNAGVGTSPPGLMSTGLLRGLLPERRERWNRKACKERALIPGSMLSTGLTAGHCALQGVHRPECRIPGGQRCQDQRALQRPSARCSGLSGIQRAQRKTG